MQLDEQRDKTSPSLLNVTFLVQKMLTNQELAGELFLNMEGKSQHSVKTNAVHVILSEIVTLVSHLRHRFCIIPA
jgi:hypothetical protein